MIKFSLYTAHCTGVATNREYKNKVEIFSAEGLTQAIEKDHIMSFCRANVRIKTNVLSSNVLFIDIDNAGGKFPNMESFKEHFKGYEYYIATSKSHQLVKGEEAACDRYHVFFPTGINMVLGEHETALRLLIEDTQSDKACKDSSRFFFGNPNAIVYWNEGESILKYLEPKIIAYTRMKADTQQVKPVAPAPSPVKQFELNPDRIAQNKTKDVPAGEPITDGVEVDSIPFTSKKHFDGWRNLVLRNYVSDVSNAKQGERNAVLTKVCYHLQKLQNGGFYKSFVNEMLNAGMACGLSQSEILATLHSISQNNEVIAYTIAEDTAVAPVKPKKKGRAEVIACAKQFLLSRYKIRFNLMLDRLEYMELATGEWQFIEDRNDNILYNALIDNPDTEYLPKNEYFMIMDVICERYDPLKDWINALPEYTKDYSSIDKLCDMFSLKYDEEEREIFKESVRKWLVASVNTIQTHKSNDLCLIFVGEGGEGKTKVWDKLVASPTYFGCIGDLRDTKDTDLLLSEKHIVLLDELSSSNRKGWEHIKHFITKAASSDRRAYGRRTQQFYRRASFVGSLNEERCLSDLDSNDRRWAIFALTPKITVDFDSITQEFRDDIYAEALMLYKQDYRFWFNNEESTNLLEYKAKYKVIRAEEELLLLHAEPSTTSYKTATQILDLLKKHTSSQLSAIVVGKLLKKLGYQQRRLKGMWVYDIYIKEPDDPSIDRGF